MPFEMAEQMENNICSEREHNSRKSSKNQGQTFDRTIPKRKIRQRNTTRQNKRKRKLQEAALFSNELEVSISSDVKLKKQERQKNSKTSDETIENGLDHPAFAVSNSQDSKDMKTENCKFIGAHCSIAGGISNAVSQAVSMSARAFGLFVRNGRTWKLSPLSLEEASKFQQSCKENNFPPHLILPHGSYLLNCGSSNPATLQKSRDTLLHELQRCEMLGLTLYNFHPGSACGEGTVSQCLDTIASSINWAHAQTTSVKTVIENMSCQGSTVGGKLEELKAIIDKVKDKSRIGVCLDTCHAFAAGYDLSTNVGFTKFMDEFNEKVGLEYLCAMHLNDSKGERGCHLDRHENIGQGRIGLQGFAHMMKDPRLNNIPMILETPPSDYAGEIKLLYSLT